MILDWATNGCPTNCGPDWTQDQIKAYLAYSNHTSANSPQAIQAITAETQERIAAGICQAVSWNTIKVNPPPHLKISPLAAIPHKTRLFRLIHDLSFSLCHTHNAAPFQPVNRFSDKDQVPHHSMHELGNVIPRLLRKLATLDTRRPIFFTKIDLKDGYWRVRVTENGKWNFAYALPQLSQDSPEDITLILCLALAMGWIDSPPFFCGVTETARDVMEDYDRDETLEPHPLEHYMMNMTQADIQQLPLAPPMEPPTPAHKEVYMDDFLALCQAHSQQELLHHSRAMLHAIHDLFPPPSETGSTLEDPISITKLESDGAWSTTKEILGWLFDGTTRTVSITKEKHDKLMTRIDELLKDANKKRPRIKWKLLNKMQGKFNWLANAIVTGKPLLGQLDQILHQAEGHKYMNLTPTIVQLLTDWKAMISQLYQRPLSVFELLPTSPTYRGWKDASTTWGAGGVWFGGTNYLLPIVWFLKWPKSILEAVATKNLTINDLELFAVVIEYLVLEAAVPGDRLHQHSVAIWSDNTSAVSRVNKLRNSKSAVAHRLLRVLTTRLVKTKAAPLSASHVSGEFNTLADFASREHSTDTHSFLTAFTNKFPPPQNGFWTLCQIPYETQQLLFSLMLPKPPSMASLQELNVTDFAFGTIGSASSPTASLRSAPSFRISHEQNKSLCWQPSANLFGLDNTERDAGKLAHKLSYWHSEPLPRPTCWLENKVPWQEKQKAKSTWSSAARLRSINEMIHPQNARLHYLTQPSNTSAKHVLTTTPNNKPSMTSAPLLGSTFSVSANTQPQQLRHDDEHNNSDSVTSPSMKR
jgi:hypothetical protein